MNIFGIASILPVPGLKEDNDVILRLYENISSIREDINFIIFKPLAYPFPFRSILNGTWYSYFKLHKKQYYNCHGFKIDILPGLMFRSPLWLERFLVETLNI